MRYGVIGQDNINGWPFENVDYVNASLDTVTGITAINSGGRHGPEWWAAAWGELHKLPVQTFAPDFPAFKSEAWIKRDHAMLRQSDALIAFWDGREEYILRTIRLALSARKPVIIFPVY